MGATMTTVRHLGFHYSKCLDDLAQVDKTEPAPRSKSRILGNGKVALSQPLMSDLEQQENSLPLFRHGETMKEF
jgi:hypothetical protein